LGAETVIIDEASMLTEEMLGATLDAVRGAKRVILIGDPRQLPPIGAGRPFVDLERRLAPVNRHALFPRVATGFAELTVRRRQGGLNRIDLQLAEWFSGSQLAPGEDDVFDKIAKEGGSEHIQFVRWEAAEDLQERLIESLVKELELAGKDDIGGFDKYLKATVKGEFSYFNRNNADDRRLVQRR
jgi:hypothetical protein